MPLEMTSRDEREVTVPVPATAEQGTALATFVARATADGYLLVNAQEVSSGGQRDPYTVAMRLRFERSAA